MAYNNGLLNGINSYADDAQSTVATVKDYLQEAQLQEDVGEIQSLIEKALTFLEDL